MFYDRKFRPQLEPVIERPLLEVESPPSQSRTLAAQNPETQHTLSTYVNQASLQATIPSNRSESSLYTPINRAYGTVATAEPSVPRSPLSTPSAAIYTPALPGIHVASSSMSQKSPKSRVRTSHAATRAEDAHIQRLLSQTRVLGADAARVIPSVRVLLGSHVEDEQNEVGSATAAADSEAVSATRLDCGDGNRVSGTSTEGTGSYAPHTDGGGVLSQEYGHLRPKHAKVVLPWEQRDTLHTLHSTATSSRQQHPYFFLSDHEILSTAQLSFPLREGVAAQMHRSEQVAAAAATQRRVVRRALASTLRAVEESVGELGTAGKVEGATGNPEAGPAEGHRSCDDGDSAGDGADEGLIASALGITGRRVQPGAAGVEGCVEGDLLRVDARSDRTLRYRVWKGGKMAGTAAVKEGDGDHEQEPEEESEEEADEDEAAEGLAGRESCASIALIANVPIAENDAGSGEEGADGEAGQQAAAEAEEWEGCGDNGWRADLRTDAADCTDTAGDDGQDEDEDDDDACVWNSAVMEHARALWRDEWRTARRRERAALQHMVSAKADAWRGQGQLESAGDTEEARPLPLGPGAAVVAADGGAGDNAARVRALAGLGRAEVAALAAMQIWGTDEQGAGSGTGIRASMGPATRTGASPGADEGACVGVSAFVSPWEARARAEREARLRATQEVWGRLVAAVQGCAEDMRREEKNKRKQALRQEREKRQGDVAVSAGAGAAAALSGRVCAGVTDGAHAGATSTTSAVSSTPGNGAARRRLRQALRAERQERKRRERGGVPQRIGVHALDTRRMFYAGNSENFEDGQHSDDFYWSDLSSDSAGDELEPESAADAAVEPDASTGAGSEGSMGAGEKGAGRVEAEDDLSTWVSRVSVAALVRRALYARRRSENIDIGGVEDGEDMEAGTTAVARGAGGGSRSDGGDSGDGDGVCAHCGTTLTQSPSSSSFSCLCTFAAALISPSVDSALLLRLALAFDTHNHANAHALRLARQRRVPVPNPHAVYEAGCTYSRARSGRQWALLRGLQLAKGEEHMRVLGRVVDALAGPNTGAQATGVVPAVTVEARLKSGESVEAEVDVGENAHALAMCAGEPARGTDVLGAESVDAAPTTSADTYSASPRRVLHTAHTTHTAHAGGSGAAESAVAVADAEVEAHCSRTAALTNADDFTSISTSISISTFTSAPVSRLAAVLSSSPHPPPLALATRSWLTPTHTHAHHVHASTHTHTRTRTSSATQLTSIPAAALEHMRAAEASLAHPDHPSTSQSTRTTPIMHAASCPAAPFFPSPAAEHAAVQSVWAAMQTHHPADAVAELLLDTQHTHTSATSSLLPSSSSPPPSASPPLAAALANARVHGWPLLWLALGAHTHVHAHRATLTQTQTNDAAPTLPPAIPLNLRLVQVLLAAGADPCLLPDACVMHPAAACSAVDSPLSLHAALAVFPLFVALCHTYHAQLHRAARVCSRMPCRPHPVAASTSTSTSTCASASSSVRALADTGAAMGVDMGMSASPTATSTAASSLASTAASKPTPSSSSTLSSLSLSGSLALLRARSLLAALTILLRHGLPASPAAYLYLCARERWTPCAALLAAVSPVWHEEDRGAPCGEEDVTTGEAEGEGGCAVDVGARKGVWARVVAVLRRRRAEIERQARERVSAPPTPALAPASAPASPGCTVPTFADAATATTAEAAEAVEVVSDVLEGPIARDSTAGADADRNTDARIDAEVETKANEQCVLADACVSRDSPSHRSPAATHPPRAPQAPHTPRSPHSPCSPCSLLAADASQCSDVAMSPSLSFSGSPSTSPAPSATADSSSSSLQLAASPMSSSPPLQRPSPLPVSSPALHLFATHLACLARSAAARSHARALAHVAAATLQLEHHLCASDTTQNATYDEALDTTHAAASWDSHIPVHVPASAVSASVLLPLVLTSALLPLPALDLLPTALAPLTLAAPSAAFSPSSTSTSTSASASASASASTSTPAAGLNWCPPWLPQGLQHLLQCTHADIHAQAHADTRIHAEARADAQTGTATATTAVGRSGSIAAEVVRSVHGMRAVSVYKVQEQESECTPARVPVEELLERWCTALTRALANDIHTHADTVTTSGTGSTDTTTTASVLSSFSSSFPSTLHYRPLARVALPISALPAAQQHPTVHVPAHAHAAHACESGDVSACACAPLDPDLATDLTPTPASSSTTPLSTACFPALPPLLLPVCSLPCLIRRICPAAAPPTLLPLSALPSFALSHARAYTLTPHDNATTTSPSASAGTAPLPSALLSLPLLSLPALLSHSCALPWATAWTRALRTHTHIHAHEHAHEHAHTHTHASHPTDTHAAAAATTHASSSLLPLASCSSQPVPSLASPSSSLSVLQPLARGLATALHEARLWLPPPHTPTPADEAVRTPPHPPSPSPSLSHSPTGLWLAAPQRALAALSRAFVDPTHAPPCLEWGQEQDDEACLGTQATATAQKYDGDGAETPHSNPPLHMPMATLCPAPSPSPLPYDALITQHQAIVTTAQALLARTALRAHWWTPRAQGRLLHVQGSSGADHATNDGGGEELGLCAGAGVWVYRSPAEQRALTCHAHTHDPTLSTSTSTSASTSTSTSGTTSTSALDSLDSLPVCVPPSPICLASPCGRSLLHLVLHRAATHTRAHVHTYTRLVKLDNSNSGTSTSGCSSGSSVSNELCMAGDTAGGWPRPLAHSLLLALLAACPPTPDLCGVWPLALATHALAATARQPDTAKQRRTTQRLQRARRNDTPPACTLPLPVASPAFLLALAHATVRHHLGTAVVLPQPPLTRPRQLRSFRQRGPSGKRAGAHADVGAGLSQPSTHRVGRPASASASSAVPASPLAPRWPPSLYGVLGRHALVPVALPQHTPAILSCLLAPAHPPYSPSPSSWGSSTSAATAAPVALHSLPPLPSALLASPHALHLHHALHRTLPDPLPLPSLPVLPTASCSPQAPHAPSSISASSFPALPLTASRVPTLHSLLAILAAVAPLAHTHTKTPTRPHIPAHARARTEGHRARAQVTHTDPHAPGSSSSSPPPSFTLSLVRCSALLSPASPPVLLALLIHACARLHPSLPSLLAPAGVLATQVLSLAPMLVLIAALLQAQALKAADAAACVDHTYAQFHHPFDLPSPAPPTHTATPSISHPTSTEHTRTDMRATYALLPSQAPSRCFPPAPSLSLSFATLRPLCVFLLGACTPLAALPHTLYLPRTRARAQTHASSSSSSSSSSVATAPISADTSSASPPRPPACSLSPPPLAALLLPLASTAAAAARARRAALLPYLSRRARAHTHATRAQTALAAEEDEEEEDAEWEEVFSLGAPGTFPGTSDADAAAAAGVPVPPPLLAYLADPRHAKSLSSTSTSPSSSPTPTSPAPHTSSPSPSATPPPFLLAAHGGVAVLTSRPLAHVDGPLPRLRTTTSTAPVAAPVARDEGGTSTTTNTSTPSQSPLSSPSSPSASPSLSPVQHSTLQHGSLALLPFAPSPLARLLLALAMPTSALAWLASNALAPALLAAVMIECGGVEWEHRPRTRTQTRTRPRASVCVRGETGVAADAERAVGERGTDCDGGDYDDGSHSDGDAETETETEAEAERMRVGGDAVGAAGTNNGSNAVRPWRGVGRVVDMCTSHTSAAHIDTVAGAAAAPDPHTGDNLAASRGLCVPPLPLSALTPLLALLASHAPHAHTRAHVPGDDPICPATTAPVPPAATATSASEWSAVADTDAASVDGLSASTPSSPPSILSASTSARTFTVLPWRWFASLPPAHRHALLSALAPLASNSPHAVAPWRAPCPASPCHTIESATCTLAPSQCLPREAGRESGAAEHQDEGKSEAMLLCYCSCVPQRQWVRALALMTPAHSTTNDTYPCLPPPSAWPHADLVALRHRWGSLGFPFARLPDAALPLLVPAPALLTTMATAPPNAFAGGHVPALHRDALRHVIAAHTADTGSRPASALAAAATTATALSETTVLAANARAAPRCNHATLRPEPAVTSAVHDTPPSSSSSSSSSTLTRARTQLASRFTQPSAPTPSTSTSTLSLALRLPLPANTDTSTEDTTVTAGIDASAVIAPAALLSAHVPAALARHVLTRAHTARMRHERLHHRSQPHAGHAAHARANEPRVGAYPNTCSRWRGSAATLTASTRTPLSRHAHTSRRHFAAAGPVHAHGYRADPLLEGGSLCSDVLVVPAHMSAQTQTPADTPLQPPHARDHRRLPLAATSAPTSLALSSLPTYTVPSLQDFSLPRSRTHAQHSSTTPAAPAPHAHAIRVHPLWSLLVPHVSLPSYVYPRDMAVVAQALRTPSLRKPTAADDASSARVATTAASADSIVEAARGLRRNGSFCGYVWGIEPIPRYSTATTRKRAPTHIPYSEHWRAAVARVDTGTRRRRKGSHDPAGTAETEAGGSLRHGEDEDTAAAIVQPQYPQFTAAELGIGISAFGDSSSAGMPWDVVNRLLWVLDDIVLARGNPTHGAIQSLLAETKRANPHLTQVLFEPDDGAHARGGAPASAVLLGSWFEAWQLLWDEDMDAVHRFLRRCDQRERFAKGK